VIFGLVTLGHLRIVEMTGARRSILIVALAAVAITLLTFTLTTLINEPASMVTLVGILILSIALDLAWSRRRPAAPQAGAGGPPGTDPGSAEVPTPSAGGPA
jgi:hypothetical protein